MKYSDPQAAFRTAIRAGVLSDVERADNWAGVYMYMGDNDQGQHLFKHRYTRKYLPPVDREAV